LIEPIGAGKPVIKTKEKQPTRHEDGVRQRNQGSKRQTVTEKLVRRHSDDRAVGDSNLKVYSGTTLGSLATNRACRTRHVRILTTLAKPTSRGGEWAIEIMNEYLEALDYKASGDEM
jgi:ABC-type uncharacterized transport system ATPase subunit